MRNSKTIPFLDYWYVQTLQHTTQDQIGFPFAIQMNGMNPYTVPEEDVNGDTSNKTSFYIKHSHGK